MLTGGHIGLKLGFLQRREKLWKRGPLAAPTPKVEVISNKLRMNLLQRTAELKSMRFALLCLVWLRTKLPAVLRPQVSLIAKLDTLCRHRVPQSKDKHREINGSQRSSSSAGARGALHPSRRTAPRGHESVPQRPQPQQISDRHPVPHIPKA